MFEVDAIDVHYGEVRALSGISLNVLEREIVALIGSNGAGKSTLLKATMGLIRPIRGKISFKGLILNNKPTHEIVEAGLLMVPEGRGGFPRMSVTENLEMGAFIRRARREREKTIRWVYEIFPVLKDRQNQLAGSLSGGEQQMLAIGRGLMACPTLLLLDEVSLGLAPLYVQHLLQIIKHINEAKVSIFIVDQNIFMALRIADRGYVIENGHIVGHGKATSLLCNGFVKNAYLGQS
jgi:branched-chain amino acid transport system ATP-binding protein